MAFRTLGTFRRPLIGLLLLFGLATNVLAQQTPLPRIVSDKGRHADPQHTVIMVQPPVRARLIDRAEDWPWSSVAALLAGESNAYVDVAPALARVGNFRDFLGEPFDEALTYAALRKAESVGRPVGSREWLADMEARTGLALAPGKRGPKPKAI